MPTSLNALSDTHLAELRNASLIQDERLFVVLRRLFAGARDEIPGELPWLG
jgi:hypothetical protein